MGERRVRGAFTIAELRRMALLRRKPRETMDQGSVHTPATFRVWIIGENNPYQVEEIDEFALYPSPRGCAGWRLCHLIFRMDPDDYCQRFARRNLLHQERWSAPAARASAARIAREAQAGDTFVLLGAKVTRAFGLEFSPFTVVQGRSGLGHTRRVAILPHPSGLSRAWNDPASFDRAREVLRRAGAL